MADDEKKDRRTSSNEPAEGHHGAHEKQKTPYGSEVDGNEEQAKRKDEKPSDGGG